MAPNSLIFLVIIGIWAAYLGKYWLRRRDHLATARSMDRFSESIRILGQGRAAPSTDVHRAPHRSYVLTPGGPMRPQVTVKRSVPVADPQGSAPRARGRRVPRPVRGVLLLVALAGLVVSVPLALLWDRFPIWGPLVVLANAVAAFLFLRASVQADLSTKRDRVPATGAASRPQTGSAVRPARRPVAQAPVVEQPAADAAPESEPVPAGPPAAREELVFDDPTLAPATPAAARRTQPRRTATVDPVPVEADDDIPATWDPRPVPTPTYAMKQRAQHPVAPAAIPVPEPIELEDDDEVGFGRVSGA